VPLRVRTVPAVVARDVQPSGARVVNGDDDVGGEVGPARRYGVTEADEDGALAALDFDGQVTIVRLQARAEGGGGALLQLARAAPARAVEPVGVVDDNAQVDVGQRCERVAVGNAAVDLDA